MDRLKAKPLYGLRCIFVAATKNATLPLDTTTTYDVICFLHGDEYKFLDVGKIIYIEGAHNYCHIYCLGAVSYKNVSLTMTDMEELLPGELFYRVHKSFFVGKKYMDTMNKIKTRIFCVNGITVNIGRSYRPEFLRRLRMKKDKDTDTSE